MASISELFEERVGGVLIRQSAFSAFLGDHRFKVSFDEGVIDFEDKGRYRFEILGTFSNEEQSWLWAWANEEIPADLKKHVETVRLIGEQKDIFELVEAEVFVDEAEPEVLAIVSTKDGACYYKAPYSKGEVYLLVEDPPIPSNGSYNKEFVKKVLEEISTSFFPDINLKRVALSFLPKEGFSISKEGDNIFIAKRSDDILRLEFDDEGKLLSIT